ncbi:MAG: filamentous hemagglutinin N-terminal domain-containing protein [Pseudomonadota bacterium]
MTRNARQPSRSARGFPLKPVAFALACVGLAPAFAQIVPTGGSVVGGSVAIGTPAALANGGRSMGINQTTTRGIVNWTSFSIGALDRVNVVQPSTASVLLNRVTGSDPSLIAGALSTSLAGAPTQRGGSVFLVNPSGVTFAGTSSVSVGGLVASTLDIKGPDETTRNASFMSSGLFDQATVGGLSFAGSSANGVTVQTGASITADPGGGARGTVALIGATVSNAGNITAPGGSIHLGSASDVTLVLDPIGDGLTTLRINSPSAIGALVENTGALTADGGRIALRAAATAAGTVVRQAGVVQAKSIATRGGEIVLDASAGAAGNLISIEGGSLDASGTAAGVAGGTITVTAPAIRIGVPPVEIPPIAPLAVAPPAVPLLDASGTTGGAVTLASTGALGLAPEAAVRADGSAGAGGSINITAIDDATLAGALSARGATNGGQITTNARVLQVARTAQVDAGGGSGANGSWSLGATYNLHVTAAGTGNDPAYDPDDFGGTNRVSAVADAALGGALGRATDVTLSGQGVTVPTTFAPDGVRFEAGAQVLKTEGRAATFTVNSDRAITMLNGSAIGSTSGALNVDFNADAKGAALGATVPITDDGDTSQRVGNILLQGASITTAGGNIRFYGQSDATGGRAIGGYSGSAGGERDGIIVNASTLDTCEGASCAGAGSIALRGQGATVSGFNGLTSGAGVLASGGTLRTGAGAITIDGRGGLGASGVQIESYTPPVASGPASTTPSRLLSASGDVTLTGVSRGWAAGDGGDTYDGAAGNAGVRIAGTDLQTGGNVRIDGQGADVSLLQQDADFLGAAASANSGAGSSFGASFGVQIVGSNITAGAGRQLDVLGTAGSRGFTVNGGGTPVLTPSAVDSFGVLVQAGQTNGLQAEGGQIAIDGRGTDVGLVQFGAGALGGLPYASAPSYSVGTTPRELVSAASGTGNGGSVAITGRNVVIDGNGTVAQVDASGATGGGSVTVRGVAQAGVAASGIVSAGAASLVAANATGNGSGGSVQLIGGSTLRAFGQLQARGGSAGGSAANGGNVETSAPYFDLRGLTIDASAPAGTAGAWLIDPFNVSIVPGAAIGSLPTNPFVPLATSVVQDGDINRALNAGTSVTITTGTGGSPLDGDIVFADGANINYTAANGPLTFRLDANRSIRSASPNVTVQSSGAGDALNVVFNADANNSGPSVGGGQVSFDGAIYTNGGDVTMNANWSATGGADGAIGLRGVTIDTRVGRSDAGAGGNVVLNGQTTTPGANDLSTLPAILINDTTIATSTGNVTIDGSATNNTGVRIDAGSAITTTTGNVSVTGRGTDKPAGAGSSLLVPSAGVLVSRASIGTVAGGITLRGYVNDTPKAAASDSAGVRVQDGAQIATSGGGDIEISGSAQAGGVGVVLQPGLTPAFATGATPGVSGSRHVLLRARNDGSTDAIVIEAPVAAAGVLNLRPGNVDATGAASDGTATPIVLGGGAANGFAVSSAEFAQLQAPTIVVGSDAQAADIRVAGAIATPNALTLQNGGGGNIALEGAVSAATLGLLSTGNVTQTAAAPITAGTLLARSTNGAVDLSSAANDVGTLGGSAAGGFRHVDANALTVGPVSVLGVDAATNLPQAESAGALTAGNVLVRTLTGDLSLGTDVNGGSGTDLVAGARFQNLGAYAIGGGNWRIWADTWVGETRGGLAGSGPLPNLYHCAYLGLCTVTVPATDNHFIYAQQPIATVVVGNATRNFGTVNPPFVYSVTGLILGDGAGSVTGTPQTAAGPGSLPGSYAIGGSFSSAAGYAINVVAGTLDVTAAASSLPLQLLALPKVDLIRDLPLTYTFDRNIGPPPICFATGPLEGDRASQGGDVLAREWSRVRSRPNLLSCVSTDRRNGCADF